MIRPIHFAFFLLLSLSPFLRAEPLKLASDVWPPFTNHVGKTRTALNLVSEALGRSGTRSKMTILGDFSEVTKGVQSKVYDGSAAVWHTPERDAVLLFSDPYLENRLVLVGRKGSDVSAESLEALVAGSKVGLVRDYAYGEEITKATSPEFVYGSSDQDNLDKLLSKQVDYMLVDDLLISYLLQYQREDASKFLQVGTHHMSIRSLHFAIRKETPEASLIMEKFNAEIMNMLRDGSYNRILKLKWIGADIDGDGRLELVATDRFLGSDKPKGGYNVLFGKMKFNKKSEPSSYYVDGKEYQDWSKIPADKKIAERPRVNNPTPSVNAFNFPF